MAVQMSILSKTTTHVEQFLCFAHERTYNETTKDILVTIMPNKEIIDTIL